MESVLANSLFDRQNKRFQQINDLAIQFSATCCGSSIIRDNIFAVMENYARKKELDLEQLRYPFHDEELWALIFMKKGTIFVCVNSDLALCKQFLLRPMNCTISIVMRKYWINLKAALERWPVRLSRRC